MKSYTVLFVYLLTSSISLVAHAECSNIGSRLNIAYINGMFTSEENFQQTIEELESTLNSPLSSQGHEIRYSGYYNMDEVALEQIAQVISQRIQEADAEIVRYILEYYQDVFNIINTGMNSAGLNYTAFGIIWSIVGDDVEQFLSNALSAPFIGDEDLDAAVESIYPAIADECNKILLIAHSQGNLYANEIWERIYSRTVSYYNLDQFKIMGQLSIASPSSTVGSNLTQGRSNEQVTDYVNHSNDFVVYLMELLGLETLTANTGEAPSADLLAHGILDSYLGVPEVNAMIVSRAESIASKLEPWALERSGISSSAIASIGYNDFDRIMDVEFISSGKEYRYYDVPEETYIGLLSAESAGEYFNHRIRNDFDYYRFY